MRLLKGIWKCCGNLALSLCLLAFPRPLSAATPLSGTDICYGGPGFVAVGPGWINYSSDGETWVPAPNTAAFIPSQVKFAEGEFLAFGEMWAQGARNQVLWRSTNGLEWTQEPITKTNSIPVSDSLADLHAGGLSLRSRSLGLVQASFNESGWLALSKESLTQLPRAMAYGARKWISVGQGSEWLRSSNDGFNWHTALTLFYPTNSGSPRIPLYSWKLPSVRRYAGQSAILRVEHPDGGPRSFRWFKAELELPGQTNRYLHFPRLSERDAGEYRVVVQEVYNPTLLPARTSNWARVELLSPQTPRIIRQPKNTIAFLGDVLMLEVEARGSPPLSYQWFRGGRAIQDATNRAFVFTFDRESVEAYQVEVSNELGEVKSDPFSLTPAPDPIFTTAFEQMPRFDLDPDWRRVVWGLDRFVVIGGASNILVSMNGANWQSAAIPSRGSPIALGWSGKDFLCGTTEGEFFRSEDGLSWVRREQAPGPINCFMQTPFRLIAGGSRGEFYVRTNAGWSTYQIGGNARINNFYQIGPDYVAIGYPDLIQISRSGVHWAPRNAGTNISWKTMLPIGPHHVIFGAGATESFSSVYEYASLNVTKLSWNSSDYGLTILSGLSFRGRPIVLGKDNQIASAYIFIEQAWRRIELPQIGWLNDGAANDHLAVMAGDAGTLLTSTDGTRWESVGAPPGRSWHFNAPTGPFHIIHDGNRFIETSSRRIRISTNGMVWSSLPTIPPESNGNLYLEGSGYFLQSKSGTFYSSNLGTWSRTPPSFEIPCFLVDRSGEHFRAVRVMHSKSGRIEWLRQKQPGTLAFPVFQGIGQRVWVTSSTGALYESLDGQNWEKLIGPNSLRVESICHARGIYLAVGNGGLFTSTNGDSWDRVPLPGYAAYSVQSQKDRFFLVTQTGELLCSHNGRNWNRSFRSPNRTPFELVLGESDMLVYASTGDSLLPHYARIIEHPRYLVMRANHSRQLVVEGEQISSVSVESSADSQGPWTIEGTIELQEDGQFSSCSLHPVETAVSTEPRQGSKNLASSALKFRRHGGSPFCLVARL